MTPAKRWVPPCDGLAVRRDYGTNNYPEIDMPVGSQTIIRGVNPERAAYADTKHGINISSEIRDVIAHISIVHS
jgi:hypothetical protein